MQGFQVQRRYRILSRLGEGGSGIVYLAVAHGPGGVDKLVALKASKAGIGLDLARDEIFAEARVSALLNHPNIVQTYGTAALRGRPLIVMEFLQGQPLHRLMQRAWETRGSVPLSLSLRMIRDLLAGLHYAHDLVDLAGTPLCLVHRDVTPQNVMVTFHGSVKVLDFGIVKTSSSWFGASDGPVRGKLSYMAPEQLAGERVDRRADLFGVGVILWELLANQRMRKNALVNEILKSLAGRRLPSPRTLNPSVPIELERICMKALEPDRHARYCSAAELQRDLDAWGNAGSEQALSTFMTELFPSDEQKTRTLVALRLARPHLSLPPAKACAAEQEIAAEPVEATLTAHRSFWLGV
jgi:serine/threonine protein kinase